MMADFEVEWARAVGAKEERARVARWIRAQIEHYPEDVFPPEGTTPDAIAARTVRHYAALWARCIEEGRHIAESGA